MTVFYIIVFAFLGLAVGSFLNVCSDRLHRGESVVNLPSHCEACHHRLGVKDLIPLLSYLRLKGRCRYCQTSIPKRVFWVELATGVIFAFLYWWCVVLKPEALGIIAFGVMAFYVCLFILIFVVDLEHKLILNRVVYPGMGVALLFALFLPQPWIVQWFFTGIANFALGAGIGLGLFFLLALASRGGMGWGDVKLAALIGLAAGFPLILVALIIGAILGGVVALTLLVSKKRGRKETIPFGPFLSVAAMVTLLWGNSMLNWYVGLAW